MERTQRRASEATQQPASPTTRSMMMTLRRPRSQQPRLLLLLIVPIQHTRDYLECLILFRVTPLDALELEE